MPLAVQDLGPRRRGDRQGHHGPYVAAVHFTFDSIEAMSAALAAEGTGDVLADIPNYTTITPVQQISEIVG